MDLKFHVCSFEQAKKIDELGIQQESLFYYNTFNNISSSDPLKLYTILTDNNDVDLDENGDEKKYITNHNYYSAFTTGELLVILNKTITLNQNELKESASVLATHLINQIKKNGTRNFIA
jgi:hypothetical protein